MCNLVRAEKRSKSWFFVIYVAANTKKRNAHISTRQPTEFVNLRGKNVTFVNSITCKITMHHYGITDFFHHCITHVNGSITQEPRPESEYHL